VSVFRNRRFLALFSATTVSALGDGASSVAYPWLAAAITRNALLVAMVAVAQQLPWLVFSLPAGVIIDRVDRRRVMVAMDTARGLLTVVVGAAVLAERHHLPAPGHTTAVVGTQWGLYAVLVVATLLLGVGQVLRDNAGQTLLPAVVERDDLEAANARTWSAQGVGQAFLGPPLGAALLGVAYFLPFVFDATSFFAAAGVVATIPGIFTARPRSQTTNAWHGDLREGISWLWQHDLLRPLAVILGLMNLASAVSMSTWVLFCQEVMHTRAVVFSLLGMGAALGGVVGGQVSTRASQRFGPGACLAVVLGGEAVLSAATGLVARWPVVIVLFAVEALLSLLWNVITVSLRQAIIPAHLLGRVNSVYRFFAIGTTPIGAAIGGLVVLVVGHLDTRANGLRATWLVNATIYGVLFVVGRRALTTARISAARQGAASNPPEADQ